MTQFRLPAVFAVVIAVVSGCSTVDSRIARNRAAFDTWPAAVQAKVVEGEIGIGFTPEQVRVALGEPDRIWVRETTDGTSEVWSYRDRSPRIGFGVGFGMGTFGGGRGSYSTIGIGLGTGYRDDEKIGVVFDRTGRVAAIETRSSGR